jgi:cytidylate kinase
LPASTQDERRSAPTGGDRATILSRVPPNDARLVVAIDGPASSGKSSVGAAAAAAIGYRFCDTGLLYRAVTWLAMRRGISEEDAAGLVKLVADVDLVPDAAGRLAHVSVDGVDATSEVHGPDVDARVSDVSRVPELRAALLARQRDLVGDGGIVMAGRDIGTVVLPDADLKIFLDASAEERARRRAMERGFAPDGAEAAEILAALRARDDIDTHRPVAPLRPAPDAHHVRTDGNTFQETVDLVVAEIRRAESAPAKAAVAHARRATPSTREGATPGATPRVTEPPGSAKLPRRSPRRRRIIRTRIEGNVNLFLRFATFVGRVVARAITRVRVEGDFSKIPREGGLLLASNHASNADPIVLGAFLTSRLGRRQNWLGKRELFDWPIVGWGAQNLGIHPLDRSIADVEAFRTAVRILDEGHVLTVFPEGTRSPDGALQEGKDGTAVLALRTHAPIVPVAIIGSDRVWPKGRALPRLGGQIVIRVGEPFRASEDGHHAMTTGAARRAESSRVTADIMARIAALLPPRQRGVYADPADRGRTSPVRQ